MIAESFPPDLERFVEEQIAVGNYQSEQELMVSAVRVLQNVQARQQEFYEDVRLGMEQLEGGEFVEYDEEGLRKFFKELEQIARNRVESGAEGGK
jgi:Arc/MetJ-type ribon-helix-helix transcriptional regulator